MTADDLIEMLQKLKQYDRQIAVCETLNVSFLAHPDGGYDSDSICVDIDAEDVLAALRLKRGRIVQAIRNARTGIL